MIKFVALLVVVLLGHVCLADDSPALKKYKKQYCTRQLWPGDMNPKCKSAPSFCGLNTLIDHEVSECPKKVEGKTVADYMAVKSCSARWERLRTKMTRFLKKNRRKGSPPEDSCEESNKEADE
jgi:hypothetical protein